MGVVIDSRQQRGKHDHKHEYFEKEGVNTTVCALPFGDYALPPSVSVDTKKDIYELAQNIDHEHTRFRNELIKAKEMCCSLIILVENDEGVTDLETLAAWRESAKHYNMRRTKSGNMLARRIEGMRLAKACSTMQKKYGVRFLFCHPDDAGRTILELLGEGADGRDA